MEKRYWQWLQGVLDFLFYYILQLPHAFFQQFLIIKMTQVNNPLVINLPKNYVYVSNLVNQSQP